MTDTTLYELKNVVKTYGRGETLVRAIDGIDLTVAHGEFVVIAGPSGSGKTTLLQLLGALDRPSSGEVLFEGRDLHRLPDRELARLRRSTIGFIFQQFNLIPTLTAVQNIELALAPSNIKGAERRSRSRELLERVGLAARASHLPSQLSGGEQQRVAIARALSHTPRVLLADEPTGNLDSATGASILDLLHALNRQEGLSILLITHDPSIALGAERVVNMRDGRLSAGLTPVGDAPAGREHAA